MPISLEEVRRIAALAHVELDEVSAERVREHLVKILEYVGKLDELDTSGVAPAIGVTEEGEAARADEAQASLPIGESLLNAPDSGERQFKVPRVLPG